MLDLIMEHGLSQRLGKTHCTSLRCYFKESTLTLIHQEKHTDTNRLSLRWRKKMVPFMTGLMMDVLKKCTPCRP